MKIQHEICQMQLKQCLEGYSQILICIGKEKDFKISDLNYKLPFKKLEKEEQIKPKQENKGNDKGKSRNQ